MSTLGWLFTGFALLRMLVAFTNWAGRLYFPKKYRLTSKPTVSILIPARNEEKNIGLLLDDLSKISYPQLEIIIYDDLSDDATLEIARQYVSRYPHIKVIKGEGPESQWLGKNYGCYKLAGAAHGDKLLFLDADVRVCPDLVEKALAYAEKYQLQLLSVFPKQIMPSWGSKLAVPLMNWILLSLLPLPLVRLTRFSSLSAANGQFMLFDSESYRQLQPHRVFRSHQVEDIAIARYFKSNRKKIATILGSDHDIRCRMYDTLNEAVQGFSKNIFQFFGGSKILTFLFAILTTLAPLYLFIFEGITYGLIYLVIILFIRFFISRASKQSSILNMLLIIPQQFVFWKIIISAYKHHQQKNIIWKDRNISASSSS